MHCDCLGDATGWVRVIAGRYRKLDRLKAAYRCGVLLLIDSRRYHEMTNTGTAHDGERQRPADDIFRQIPM